MQTTDERNENGTAGNATCAAACAEKVSVVTGVGDLGSPIHREETIDALLEVLWRRTDRLVDDRDVAARLKPLLGQFLCNLVTHFADSESLDSYTRANIATALATADNHARQRHGVEDYSTLIRRPNPTDADADRYFIVGRAGKASDDECPLSALGEARSEFLGVSRPQLHMYYAFHHARARDAARGAPSIPAEEFVALVPEEVRADEALEDAFLDVCLSDGAWELYEMHTDPDLALATAH
jgi:hypothetical protein